MKHGIAIYKRSKKGDKLIDFKETDYGEPSLRALRYYMMQGDTKTYRFTEESIEDDVYEKLKVNA